MDADAGENSRSRNDTWWFTTSEFKLNPMHLDKSDMVPQDLYCLLIFDSVYSWCLSCWLFFWWSGGKKESYQWTTEEGECWRAKLPPIFLAINQGDASPGLLPESDRKQTAAPCLACQKFIRYFEYLRYECRLNTCKDVNGCWRVSVWIRLDLC